MQENQTPVGTTPIGTGIPESGMARQTPAVPLERNETRGSSNRHKASFPNYRTTGTHRLDLPSTSWHHAEVFSISFTHPKATDPGWVRRSAATHPDYELQPRHLGAPEKCLPVLVVAHIGLVTSAANIPPTHCFASL